MRRIKIKWGVVLVFFSVLALCGGGAYSFLWRLEHHDDPLPCIENAERKEKGTPDFYAVLANFESIRPKDTVLMELYSPRTTACRCLRGGFGFLYGTQNDFDTVKEAWAEALTGWENAAENATAVIYEGHFDRLLLGIRKSDIAVSNWPYLTILKTPNDAEARTFRGYRTYYVVRGTYAYPSLGPCGS
jgi:hypothetical protein